MKKIFLITIFFLAGFLLSQSAQATTISPLIVEIDLDPGQVDQTIMKIFNETDQDLYLNGSIETFQPKGEGGEAEILPADVANESISWLKLPLNSIALNPGEAIQVPLIIDIPSNAGVGGYYFAIMWETVAGPKLENNQVGISSRVGTLILLKINGEVQEELKISSFNLKNKGKFYNSLPIVFLSHLKNSGNIHLKPQGHITIKNIFGQVSEVLPFNNQNGNILPQSIRRFETTWPNNLSSDKHNFLSGLKFEFKNFIFGKFTAQLQLDYGSQPQRNYSEEIGFWIIPWRISLSLLVVVILFLVIRIIGFKKRKFKR